MTTLGEKLKRERETRGVSLSEISRATNIRTNHLSALEEDDFDALPGPVFVTGFLRAYSHHLGLDADELLIEYESLKAEQESQSDPNSTASADKGKFSVAIVISVIAIAGFLLYLGWSDRKVEKPEQPVSAMEKTDETKKLPTPESKKKSEIAPVEKAAPSEDLSDTPKIATPKPKPKPKDDPEPPAIIAVVPEPEPETEPALESEAVEKQVKTRYRLVVSAEEEDVWVLVEIDGETTRDMFVRAGKSIAFRADKSIKLTSGNARSMKLVLNGKTLDFKTTPNVIREWSLPLPE